MRRIFLMVPERGNRIFARGLSLRISDRPDGGIAYRRSVKAEQRVVRERQIVERGQLHKEIVRVLAVDDRIAVSRFSLLKQLRIIAAADRRRLKRKHCARGERAAAQLAL